jgi:hypothetical protein
LFSGREVIIGWEFNFSLGVVEVLGPRSISDPLSNYFINVLDQRGLMDIEPRNLIQHGEIEGLGTTGWQKDWIGS